jgi:hypothetical protein
MKSPFAPTFGQILKINGKLLFGIGAGIAAWYIWPRDPQWWGFAPTSILLGLGAVGAVVQAFSLMAKIHQRNQAIGRYLQKGGAPRNARLADERDLRDAGMIDE